MAPIGGEKKNFAVNGKISVLGRDLHSKRAKFKSHLYKHNNFKNLFLGGYTPVKQGGKGLEGRQEREERGGDGGKGPIVCPSPQSCKPGARLKSRLWPFN